MGESHAVGHRADFIRQSGEAVADVWTDLRSFDFKWIVPYRTAVSATVLWNPITWMTLGFGFVPLLAGFAVANLDELLTWLLTYFGVAWGLYFYAVVARRTAPLLLGLIAAVLTLVIGFQLVLWLKAVPPLSLLYALTLFRSPGARFVGFVLGVALNEEVIKAAPVLVLAFVLRRIEKPMDGMYCGALSGVAFAVREAHYYIAHAGNMNAILYQALLRTTTLPFLHATWTGISGYFIGLAVLAPGRRAALCVAGIAVAAVLHGSYDFSSEQLISVGIAAFVYLLFISYIERSQEMVQELRRAAPALDKGRFSAPAAR